jgi:hypothetical protein
MKGGLYIKDEYTSDSAFRYFIEYSNISFLSKGSFGIVLKCKLNDGVVSPYENLRTIYKGKEVRNMIIKFSPLHYKSEFKVGPVSSVPIELFENEVKTQIDIFNKTVDHLDPICPSIVYSKYLDRTLDTNQPHHKHMVNLLKLLNSKIKNDIIKKLFSALYADMKKSKNYTFGLIGMEMMDDYVTLHKVNNSYKDVYECIARLRLIELAVKTGYTHNDYHSGNILVNPNASVYYGKKLGHVLLIDFGYTKKIPDDILEYIIKAYNENKFYDILNIFYNEKKLSNKFPNGSGEFIFNEYPDLYSWIIPPNQMIESMNKELLSLKNDYEIYEKSVEKAGLEDKKLFKYGVAEEKKEVSVQLKTKEEEEEEPKSHKRKNVSPPLNDSSSPKKLKKSPTSILKKSSPPKSLGGKTKKNKSMKKSNRQNSKTNKRIQSKSNGK